MQFRDVRDTALGILGGAGKESISMKTPLLTRRGVIAAGVVALAGCAKTQSSGNVRTAEESLVSIVRQPAYTQDLCETVRRLLADQRLDVRG